jgi:hypothetical protein
MKNDMTTFQNRYGTAALISAAVMWISLPLYAVQPQRLLIDSAEDFAQGEVDSVVLSEPGQLKPGVALDLLHDFENTLLWDAVQLKGSENLIIGTGPEGKVFRLDSRGKVKELTAFAESDVYAVAMSPQGEIYVASSPHGKVFKMNSQGEFDVWFEHGEKYVWDMVFDRKGRLYVATGQTGKLFRVDGKMKGEVVFDADEPHLRSVIVDPQGGLIIGTTGSALIYHYQLGQEPVVLLDAARTDISAVAVSEAGIIYAAAVGQKQSSGASAATVTPSGAAVLAAVRGLVTASGSETDAADAKIVIPVAENKPVVSGKKASSEIYRIDRKRYPQVIMESEDEIHSLAWGDGRLMAGSGQGGRVFEIRDDGAAALVGRVESKQVTSIIPAGKNAHDGWILLGSNWGKVMRMPQDKQTAGSYTSKVIDSGLFAEWGRLKVHGTGKWSVRTRSGNTQDPDKSWYPWQFLKGQKSLSPQARYFQFEIKLDQGLIERVDFTWLPQNQPPVVKSVKALEPNLGFITMKQPPPPAKIQTGSQLLQTTKPLPVAVNRYRPLSEPGLRTIIWEAQDPNGDHLRYDLKIQREGGNWETLATDIEDTVFSWDTSGWPDGIYYAQVTASDRNDNGAGQELSHQKASEAWRIDHAAPEIKLVTQSSRAVQVIVSDQGGVLEAVAVSVDGQEYRISIPEDGILDSESEDFTFDRDSEQPLYIRAKDENGNVSGLHIPAEK